MSSGERKRFHDFVKSIDKVRRRRRIGMHGTRVNARGEHSF